MAVIQPAKALAGGDEGNAAPRLATSYGRGGQFSAFSKLAR